MASRRAATTLARALAPASRATTAPAPVRAAAHLASRQYHHLPARQAAQLLRQSPAWSSPTKTSATGSRLVLATKRACYSTDSADKPSKIWDFEALQKLTSNPNASITIVDVREPHELDSTGRIPGALNIPVSSAPDSFHISQEEFEDRFGYPRPASDAEVVFYCRAGVRSRAAAGLARDAGWTNVGEYPGSWLDWEGRGGEVER